MSDTAGANRHEEGASRRAAVNHSAPVREIYYDTKIGYAIVPRKKDGWDGSRDHLDKTWTIQKLRCYLADAGCEVETIRHETKVDRMDSGRYQNIDDERVTELYDQAVEANKKWMRVHNPAIPHADEGGINVYVDGENLPNKANVSETAVEMADDPFEPTVSVRVDYSEGGINHVGLTVEGKDIPVERVEVDDVLAAEAKPDDYDHRIELRHDTECEEPHQ